MTRSARVERVTKETKVLVEIDLDGTGQGDLSTGVGFYDHMLNQLAKHGGFDLTVRTEGDLEIDAHHTMEDTAIALGDAFARALGDKAGIRRFGDATVPLDESARHAASHQPSSGSGTSPSSRAMSAWSRKALLRRRCGSAAARRFMAIRSSLRTTYSSTSPNRVASARWIIASKSGSKAS